MESLSTTPYHAPSVPPPSNTTPPARIPSSVYRVQHAKMQTLYAFAAGFRSKNRSTILNERTLLGTFSVAHLTRQTNISSPFISVYDSLPHAEAVAEMWSGKCGEQCFVVTIDTNYLARGPVFRAADLLGERESEMSEEERWLHKGEYLFLYRIPAEAIRVQTPVGRAPVAGWRAPGGSDKLDKYAGMCR
ncbi:hypothetical protein CC78DRAFT_593994 [Lojkania enalia]|uniref:DUF7587 domain-containing protein n=1 Tax=Lojkania enalia TaxID=147567 RepID=A0A9P4N4W1_9PLEO|nr:hypothetical protein CC78DRAFT_593994 [Didymosphaeria enalia]